MELRKVYIYGLFDDTGCRYVGQSVSPDARFRKHIEGKDRTYKGNWIRSLFSVGSRPQIVILEVANERTYECREQAWISFGRRIGWRLTNATDGGDGNLGWIPSEETRRKISAKQKGRRLSPEHKIKVMRGIAAAQAVAQSPEAREKRRAALMGRVFSSETRRKMSESARVKVFTESHRQNMRLANLGKKRAEGFGRKLSELLIGKVRTAAMRQRMSDAQKLRFKLNPQKWSEDRRAKFNEGRAA